LALLAVVAYPELAAEDEEWLEWVRLRHDPQATRIRAHFTLVFPFEHAVETASQHVARVLEDRAPIAFVLRRAAAVADAFGNGSHVFLVPDEGAEIVAVHGRLYGGVLAPFLRADIPFVPHLTVGASDSLQAGEQLASELNRDGLGLRGVLADVQLVDVSEHRVRTLVEFSRR
jgi:2'-5' RNA ligase